MPAIVSMGTLAAGKATLLQRQGSRFRVQDHRIKKLPLKTKVSTQICEWARILPLP
jgi:hypothetical protein